MVGRGRAWWVAGGALAGGGVVWAVLRFGVPVFLTDENHPARPTLEALSWVAGIGGLAVALVALVVAMRQKPDSITIHRTDTPAASHTASGSEASKQKATVADELKDASAEAERNGGPVATGNRTVVSGTANASGSGGIAIGAVGRDANLGQAPDPHQPDRA